MTILAMIRHGDTDWNRQGLIQGHSDIPLGEEGERDVRSWRLPPDLEEFDWIASPLKRALETARLLAKREPRIEERLTEMSWGEWEGRTLAALREELGDLMRAWEARGLDFRGPEGESPRDVQDRVRPLLAELAQAGKPTVAVCHRGVIRSVYAMATGWDMVEKAPVKLRDAAVHYFILTSDGTPAVDRLNVKLGADLEPR